MGKKHHRRQAMIRLNIIVEGSCEEAFVKNLLVDHFSPLNIFVSARKIQTGWDSSRKKPAKGGLLKYSKFKNDVIRWIESDRCNQDCWYSSMVDLYKFPVGNESPYTQEIYNTQDKYLRVKLLEDAIFQDIGSDRFIPYVQLHEFETFLLIDPDRLFFMYPDEKAGIRALIK